jgi:hypothetical protein
LVEIEVRKSEAKTGSTETTNLDVNEIINKMRSFVDNVRRMGSSGEAMAVSVESFNFSVSKEAGEYDLTIKLSLIIKPKEKEVTAD